MCRLTDVVGWDRASRVLPLSGYRLRTIDCSINPSESREQEYAYATRLVKKKCHRQTFVFTISVMSSRPAFAQPARPLPVLRFGAGNGWSQMTSPLRHTVPVRVFFRREYR